MHWNPHIERIVERNQLLKMAGSSSSKEPQLSKITWGEET